jgi:hypothetical protein
MVMPLLNQLVSLCAYVREVDHDGPTARNLLANVDYILTMASPKQET